MIGTNYISGGEVNRNVCELLPDGFPIHTYITSSHLWKQAIGYKVRMAVITPFDVSSVGRVKDGLLRYYRGRVKPVSNPNTLSPPCPYGFEANELQLIDSDLSISEDRTNEGFISVSLKYPPLY